MTQQKPLPSLDIILGNCDPSMEHTRHRAAHQVVAYLLNRRKPFIPNAYIFPLYHEAAWDHYKILLEQHPDFRSIVTSCLNSHLRAGMEVSLEALPKKVYQDFYGYFCLRVSTNPRLVLTSDDKSLFKRLKKEWHEWKRATES